MEETSRPHPLAQLWHQEGAQQSQKAMPPPEPDADRALAVFHIKPPLLGKLDAEHVCFLFARARRLRAPGAPPR